MTYDKAFEKVIGHEGGYVNDPDDPGGETKFGVSDRADGKIDGAYHLIDISDMTLDEAKKIYKRDYWDKCHADKVPAEVRYSLFDMAVNAGVKTAIKCLQRSAKVKADGIIGNKTLNAVRGLNKGDFLFHRALHYMRITGNKKSLAKFLGGWANRIEDIWND